MELVTKQVVVDVMKQLFVTVATRALIGKQGLPFASSTSSSSTNSHSLSSEIDTTLFVNGIRLDDFKHNPKNNIIQESKRAQEYISRLDWKFTLTLIDSCISNLEANVQKSIAHTASNSMTSAKSTSNSIAADDNKTPQAPLDASYTTLLGSLKENLKTINTKIKEINDKIEFNKEKYWAAYRTTNYEVYINELITACRLFTSRWGMLEKFASTSTNTTVIATAK